jgi:hypothetical protein
MAHFKNCTYTFALPGNNSVMAIDIYFSKDHQ